MKQTSLIWSHYAFITADRQSKGDYRAIRMSSSSSSQESVGSRSLAFWIPASNQPHSTSREIKAFEATGEIFESFATQTCGLWFPV